MRDERDLQRHVDYTHYNPVRHGLVERVEDWPWSSYHRYASQAPHPEPHGPAARNGFQELDACDDAVTK